MMREDGTLWLNVGDSYNGSGAMGGPGKQHTNAGSAERPGNRAGWSGLKPKDLCGIPWRLVLALQADGWWWRSCIAWTKRSAMPESVRDRPSCAWEPIFLLTKAAHYFYDAEAVRRIGTGRGSGNKERVMGIHASHPHRGTSVPTEPNAGANLRNVWPIEPEDYTEWNLGPEPFPDAHFATFPTEVPRRAILAGTSAKGCCPECGAPWERIIDEGYINPGNRITNGPRSLSQRHETAGFPVRLEKITATRGWRPTCDHGLDPVPCRVLDPFLGSGTTCLVAEQLGRDSVGIELSPEYCALAECRIQASLSVTRRKNKEDRGAFRLESPL